MQKKGRLSIQYGLAVMASPVFCLLYNEIFQYNVDNIYWLLDDLTFLLFFVILYPLLEELIFRGLIQDYFAKLTKKINFVQISLANVITSLLFMVMHLVYHAPLWAILTFVPSLIFGYFKDRYNLIMPSIILHMFYNLCYFSLIGI